MRLTSLWFLAGLGLSSSPLAAQWLEPSLFARARLGGAEHTATLRPLGVRVQGVSADAGKMALGGVFLGAGGFLSGALIGDRFQRSPCEDCIEGAFYGALVGESLAIPLGVHLANGRRGQVAPAVGASSGIGAAGVGAALLTDQWGILLAIPVLQLASSIVIERHTAGRAEP